MKIRRTFLLIIVTVLICVSFTASAESQKIALSFSANMIYVVANGNMPVEVSASRAPKDDLVFEYTYLDETHTATLPAGATALTLTLKTPQVTNKATYELSIVKGELYALGAHSNANLVVMEGLTFAPYLDGYAFSQVNKTLTLNYEVRNANALSAYTAFEYRDEFGEVLATARFSKSYPTGSFKINVPGDWSGIRKAAVWMGDRKLSDDMQIVIYSNESPLYKVDTTEKKIAVTIDCGAGSAWHARRWMDLLDKYNAKVTFFVTGYWANNGGDILEEMLAHGHEIGNHTWTHPRIPEMKVSALRKELADTNQVVIDATDGFTPVYFRAPYGSWDSRMVSLISNWGYLSVQWTVDSCDSFEGIHSTTVYKNSVSDKIVPGAIVLFHNDSPHFSIMEKVFDYYTKELGMELVRVSDLIPDDDNWIIDTEGVLRTVE